jgi:formylglycine-generating enzyme required for sulfatase activity
MKPSQSDFVPSRVLSFLFLAGGILLGGAASSASAIDRGGSLPENSPLKKTEADVAAPRIIADLNLELLWIKPGTFMMGSDPDEPDRNQAEGPRTTVTLTKGFWLGKTEVTQAQYEAVAGTNPSYFKAVGANAPVEEVSWIEAVEYCRKLTERERAAGRLPEGYIYTLPTEAQWEYAYRAGSTGPYPANFSAMGWDSANSQNATHPVGLRAPNAWGLYDMPGNVLEWCQDWYGPYSPGNRTDPAGPKSGSFRTARGGSWRMAATVGRSAARAGGSAGRHDYTLGFRLALSALAN